MRAIQGHSRAFIRRHRARQRTRRIVEAATAGLFAFTCLFTLGIAILMATDADCYRHSLDPAGSICRASDWFRAHIAP